MAKVYFLLRSRPGNSGRTVSFSNRSDRFTFEYFPTLKRSGRSRSILGPTLSRSNRSKGVNRARPDRIHTLVPFDWIVNHLGKKHEINATFKAQIQES